MMILYPYLKPIFCLLIFQLSTNPEKSTLPACCSQHSNHTCYALAHITHAMNEFATLPRDENRDDLQVCIQESFNAFKKGKKKKEKKSVC